MQSERWQRGWGGYVWAALGLMLMGTGCVQIQRPAEDLASGQLPAAERFHASGQGDRPDADFVDDGWLPALGDPMLVTLVEEAQLHNPDLRRAAAVWEEAVARSRVARSYLSPRLDVTAGASRGRDGLSRNSSGRPATSSVYRVQAEASWELDLWGRVRSESAAAEASMVATALDLIYARQSLAAAVAEAWFLAIQAQLQLAIDDAKLEAERRTAQITRDKVEIGAGLFLDAELAEANLALAEAAVHRSQSAVAELTRALEVLLGRYPAAELALAAALPQVGAALAEIGVPSALLERRPDVVAADRRVAAAFHRVEAAKAARLPQVTLTGSAGALLDPTERIWSIGANLLAPIFTAGRLAAEVRVADAQQHQALADYVAVGLAAFGEVENALAGEHFLAQQEQALAHASERMRNASRIGEERYDAGILTIIELTTLRRQDFETRSLLLGVQAQRLLTRVTLHRALGGSIQAPESDAPADQAAASE